MANMLTPNFPDDVVASADAKGHRAGLSRGEYMNRVPLRERDRARAAEAPMPEDPQECFRRLAETYADARDPEIMAAAWQ